MLADEPDDALFAACPRGLEKALAAELEMLGAVHCRPAGGGVLFEGDRRTACMANLWSRLASRVLRRVGQRRYRDDDDLYRLAASVPWERYFDARRTLRVDVSAIRSPLRSLNFATLRIKDGIVDRVRARTGERPSIDTRSPDARVFAHLEDRSAVLYLDLSGESLFKRGWRSAREDKGVAPLKENLAAGLLAIGGWTPAVPLYDPFCGSGTIVIEAAQVAFDVAPGIDRSFGFEKLIDHDMSSWTAMRDDALRRRANAAREFDDGRRTVHIAASDVDPQAVEQARRNLARAGIPEGAVGLQVLDVARARAPFPAAGHVVTNPPYGERLDARHASVRAGSSAHEAAMQAFGTCLKRHFGGWHAWVLSSDPQLPRQLGMKERRRTPLYNGAIECRLFGFEIFDPAHADATARRNGPVRSDDAVRPPPSTPGTPIRR